jgi:hypothetical protein
LRQRDLPLPKSLPVINILIIIYLFINIGVKGKMPQSLNCGEFGLDYGAQLSSISDGAGAVKSMDIMTLKMNMVTMLGILLGAKDKVPDCIA